MARRSSTPHSDALEFIPANDQNSIEIFERIYRPFFEHVPEEAQTLSGFQSTLQRNESPDFQRAFGPFKEHFYLISHPQFTEPVGTTNFVIYHSLSPQFDLAIYAIYITVRVRLSNTLRQTSQFIMRQALAEYIGSKSTIRVLVACEINDPKKMTTHEISEEHRLSIDPYARARLFRRLGLRPLAMDYILCPLQPDKQPSRILQLCATAVTAFHDPIGWSWHPEKRTGLPVEDLKEFYRRTQGTNTIATTNPELSPYFQEGCRNFDLAASHGAIPYAR
jgi:hypothetical protein